MLANSSGRYSATRPSSSCRLGKYRCTYSSMDVTARVLSSVRCFCGVMDFLPVNIVDDRPKVVRKEHGVEFTLEVVLPLDPYESVALGNDRHVDGATDSLDIK